MYPPHIQAKPRQVILPGLKQLSFLYKALLALGAGNGNLALSPGNAYHLTALGAVVIPVLPILYPINQLQEFAVFLKALVGITGEAAIQCPDHQSVGNRGQQQIHLCRIDKGRNKTNYQTCGKDHHVQLICSVTTNHEITQTVTQPLDKLSNHNCYHLAV